MNWADNKRGLGGKGVAHIVVDNLVADSAAGDGACVEGSVGLGEHGGEQGGALGGGMGHGKCEKDAGIVIVFWVKGLVELVVLEGLARSAV